MQQGVEIRKLGAELDFEHEFMGQGEILVQREGYSRIRHLLTFKGRRIARLRWRGMRRAVYEADGMRFDINVGALERLISIVSEDGKESFLKERSRANPRREEMRIEMAEGDNFCLARSWDSRLRSEASFAVHKEFYTSTLLICRFDTVRRTQTTARITVEPNMKREARFLHRLLALIVCRIILERRRSGSHPLRVKERPSRFSSSSRVRERKRVRE